jgi:hypothetical protein
VTLAIDLVLPCLWPTRTSLFALVDKDLEYTGKEA